MELVKLGWDDFFSSQLQHIKKDSLCPARVISAQKNTFQVAGEQGELTAAIAGKLRHQVAYKKDLPAVGDWVLIKPMPEQNGAVILQVLQRKTVLTRKAAGSRKKLAETAAEEQVIGANIDTFIIVTALDRDFNLRRIERYLALVYSSGAQPVILLNKADLVENAGEYSDQVSEIAISVPVLLASAKNGHGISELLGYIPEGKTAALIGSSGVGKSTIINKLLGFEKQKVHQISDYDEKGMHTTTHRELICLENGGIIMDNPGMRELQLWGADENLDNAFQDIEELARNCRFSDCQHESEPSCAVKQALKAGGLDLDRYHNYIKLKRELKYLSERQHKSANLVEKEKWQNYFKQEKKRKDKQE
jgi:ribosome biogenesis GTPase / thiamine phosphate phosphatase